VNTIVSIEQEVPNVYRLVLEAQDIAAKAKAGQFVIMMVDDVGERVPFTISDWDADAGTITIFFLEMGISTMKLAKKKAGGMVHAVVGPLGKPATIENYGTCVVGGGCYGIGAIYPIARALKEAGNKVITVIEARSEYLLYNQEALSAVSDELILSTSDGTAGTKGKVRSVLEKWNEEGTKADLYYFIGCSFMMMNASRTTPEGPKTFVALNALMVDGTGMCGCCRVSVGGNTKFACVDGPEFDGKEVDWEEAFIRNSVYQPEEVLAFHHHTCKALKKGVIE